MLVSGGGTATLGNANAFMLQFINGQFQLSLIRVLTGAIKQNQAAWVRGGTLDIALRKATALPTER